MSFPLPPGAFEAIVVPEQWTCGKCGAVEAGVCIVALGALCGIESLNGERMAWAAGTAERHVCLPGDEATKPGAVA